MATHHASSGSQYEESSQVCWPGRSVAGVSLHYRQPQPNCAGTADDMNDPYRLFCRHLIMNCTEVCPKGLAPSRAIEKIRSMMVQEPL